MCEAQCPVLSPGVCPGSGCNGGVCDRGVCRSCPANKIGENCQANDAFLNIGNVAFSQAGLDFAPIEYFKPINDAYEQAKASALTAASYDGPCTESGGDSTKSFKVTIAPLTQSMFTKSDLIQSSIKFVITSTGLQISATGDFAISKARLDLYGGAFCCPCTGANCKDTLCPQVCSKTDPNDWIDFTFQATVRANVALAYSAAVQGVTATVSGVVIEFDDGSLGANLVCPTGRFQFISNLVKSYFEQLKTQIGPTLTPPLEQALTQNANRIASRYQGLQTFVAKQGVYLQYRVTDLTIVASTYIAVDVQGKVIYTQFINMTTNPACWINVTYADTASDTALLPPKSWLPLTKTLSPSGIYSPMLAGSRITRSFFNAVAWANFQNPADRTRTFIYSASNGLAAVGQVTVTVPYFRIPNDAQQARLRVSVNGQASFSCPPLQAGTVLGVNFNQLDSSFSLAYDDTPPDPSIAFQVIPGLFSVGSIQNNIVTTAPTLNNPALIQSAMVGALNFNAPALNSFLLTKGNGVLTLPPDLRASFPDAQLQIVSQSNAGSPAINGESGYIEMVNRCACSSSSQPLQNQGVDGVVNICPFSFLSRPYCSASALSRRRRRMLSEQNFNNPSAVAPIPSNDMVHRQLSTAQQEADLTTVLGTVGQQCVTRAPTGTPTTGRPTKQPTHRPTRLPTTFDGLDESRDVCEDGKNGCFYRRDVLFFVCDQGTTEVRECRYQNSDIYCCPTSGSSSSAMQSTTFSLLLLICLAAIQLLVVLV